MKTKRSWNFKDLTGKRFGRLVVVSEAAKKRGLVMWNCVCDCGHKKPVASTDLVQGHSSSCGCYREEVRSSIHTVHGLYGVPEYSNWNAMLQRCGNKSNPKYPRYGGRGIKVCERWKEFKNFYEDMGKKPSKLHSIDRINNDGNYEPGNCRWATNKEQCNNKRNNRIITIDGVSRNIKQWSEHIGIKAGTLYARIEYGFSDREVVTTPLK